MNRPGRHSRRSDDHRTGIPEGRSFVLIGNLLMPKIPCHSTWLENPRCGTLALSDLQLHAFTRGENDEFAVEMVDPVAAAFNNLIDEAVRMGGIMVEYGE